MPGKLDTALRQMAADTPLSLHIQGDCMSPLILDGARVRISRQRFYLPGDILVFRAANNRLTAHRLLFFFPGRDGIYCVTRSDMGTIPDKPVQLEQIIGRVTGGEVAPQAVDIPLLRRGIAILSFVRCSTLHFARKLAHAFRR